MKRITQQTAWFGIALLVAWIGGCGEGRPPAFPATGEVLYRGEPVADAQVTLIPAKGQGKVARGTTGASGRFELGVYTQNDGALAGEHQVTVTKMAPIGGKGDAPYAAMKSQLPEKYASATTSTLKATVSPDQPNHFKFELVD